MMSSIKDIIKKESVGWLPRLAHLVTLYLKFGLVGGVATTTHVVVFVILIEVFALHPLLANVFAFGIAVVVSFMGHFYWTFRSKTLTHFASRQQIYTAFAKFFVVALLGLTLNSQAVYLVVEVLTLSYVYAVIPMVGVVPIILFTLSKYWVYADKRKIIPGISRCKYLVSKHSATCSCLRTSRTLLDNITHFLLGLRLLAAFGDECESHGADCHYLSCATATIRPLA